MPCRHGSISEHHSIVILLIIERERGGGGSSNPLSNHCIYSALDCSVWMKGVGIITAMYTIFPCTCIHRWGLCHRGIQWSQDCGCGWEVQPRGRDLEGGVSSSVWSQCPWHCCSLPLACAVYHEELLGAWVSIVAALCICSCSIIG